MKFYNSINPLLSSRAFMLVYISDYVVSSTTINLITNPLVKGVILTKNNVRDIYQFFNLLTVLRKHKPNLMIMLEDDACMLIADHILSLEHMGADVHPEFNFVLSGVLPNNTINRVANIMLAIYNKHRLIPKLTSQKSSAPFLEREIFSVYGNYNSGIIQKIFIQKLINRNYSYHDVSGIVQKYKLNTVKVNISYSMFSPTIERKEGDVEKIQKIESSQVDAKDHLSGNWPRCMETDSVKCLTIHCNYTNGFEPELIVKISSCRILYDLIEIKGLDDQRLLSLLSHFNSPIAANVKVDALLPAEEVIVKMRSSCCQVS